MRSICGILNLDGRSVERGLLERMSASTIVPGPCATEHWLAGPVALTQVSSLAISGAMHETQPLASEDGRITVVADARLDNRDQLMRKLVSERIGPQPTDTELILAAYRRWNHRCVEHLLGDFAVAVWDAPTQRLFLARDSLGARGLCYFRGPDFFAFATDLTSILDLPGIEPHLNETKIAETLLDLAGDPGCSYFENIHYCPPAHCLVADSDGVRCWRYWDLDPEREIRYADDDEYAEHLLELIRAAIDSRLRPPGMVGISLSGGCDSTLLAAVAAPLVAARSRHTNDLKSFSYVFDTLKECDERAYIQPVVERCRLDAAYLPADELWTFRDLDQQPIARDGLGWDFYHLLPQAVARAAHEAGCRILLDGHYGDALFSGGGYLVADLIFERRVTALFSLLRRHWTDLDWHPDLLTNGIRQLIPWTIKRAYRAIRARPTNPGLTPARAIRHNDQEYGPNRGAWATQLAPGRRYRYWVMTASYWAETYATTEKLRRLPVQRLSPYFDRRLVEFVMALPAEQLGRPGRNRWIQRNATRKLLPEYVAERRSKTSFEPLLARGLLDMERERVHSLLQKPLIERFGWVQKGWLRAQVAAGRDWDASGYHVAKFLHLELWLRGVTQALAGERWATPYFHAVQADALKHFGIERTDFSALACPGHRA